MYIYCFRNRIWTSCGDHQKCLAYIQKFGLGKKFLMLGVKIIILSFKLLNLFLNVMYSCDDKSEFVAFLLQSSVPHDDLFEK